MRFEEQSNSSFFGFNYNGQGNLKGKHQVPNGPDVEINCPYLNKSSIVGRCRLAVSRFFGGNFVEAETPRGMVAIRKSDLKAAIKSEVELQRMEPASNWASQLSAELQQQPHAISSHTLTSLVQGGQYSTHDRFLGMSGATGTVKVKGQSAHGGTDYESECRYINTSTHLGSLMHRVSTFFGSKRSLLEAEDGKIVSISRGELKKLSQIRASKGALKRDQGLTDKVPRSMGPGVRLSDQVEEGVGLFGTAPDALGSGRARLYKEMSGRRGIHYSSQASYLDTNTYMGSFIGRVKNAFNSDQRALSGNHGRAVLISKTDLDKLSEMQLSADRLNEHVTERILHRVNPSPQQGAPSVSVSQIFESAGRLALKEEIRNRLALGSPIDSIRPLCDDSDLLWELHRDLLNDAFVDLAGQVKQIIQSNAEEEARLAAQSRDSAKLKQLSELKDEQGEALIDIAPFMLQLAAVHADLGDMMTAVTILMTTGESIQADPDLGALKQRLKEMALAESMEALRAANSEKLAQIAALQDELGNPFIDTTDAILALAKAHIAKEEFMMATHLLLQAGLCLDDVDGLGEVEVQKLASAFETFKKPVSKELVNHFALDQGFGFKTANLMMLENLCQQMNQEMLGANVQVPSFVGVSNRTITEFLNKHIPSLNQRWQDFLGSFPQEDRDAFMNEAQDAAKVKINMTDAGKAIIQSIQTDIKQLFVDHPEIAAPINEWLAQESPDFVIVRSTGKEDSDELSNAGGNLSVPFVKPDQESIATSMGAVVASYFGEKSIGQRLAAGDRSLFNEPPFVPVLIQEMIGENSDGQGSTDDDIPRSGVMFTYQPEKAKNVTVINTAPGNNEGVVASIVGVDSYYVDDNLQVQSVVRKKEQRMVQYQKEDGKYDLRLIDNGKSISHAPALPKKQVRNLKRVADTVAAAYGEDKGPKAMDMEYTVKMKSKKSDKPTIYLLQARPLLDSRMEGAPQPSHLDREQLATIDASKKTAALPLLDGNSWVRSIESADEVIFADNLPHALSQYLDNDDKNKVRVIISRKTAPATSHECVTLRPKGVAVMVIEDSASYSKIQAAIEGVSQDEPVLVDTQRGLIVDTAGTGVDSKAIVKEGSICYPIAKEVTVTPSPLALLWKNASTDQERAEAFQAFCDTYDQLQQKLCPSGSFAPELKSQKISTLMEIMATAEGDEAQAACGLILRRLWKKFQQQVKTGAGFQSELTQELFQVLTSAMEQVEHGILPALKKHPAQSLERLYAIKWLDAIILQSPSSEVLLGKSYASVLSTKQFEDAKLHEAAKSAGANLDSDRAIETLYAMAPAEALMSEANRQNWQAFVAKLSQNPERIQRLLQLVLKVKDTGILFEWINLRFTDAHDKTAPNATGENLLRALEKEWTSSQAEITKYQAMAPKIQKWAQAEAAFQNPKSVRKLLPKLEKEYLEDFGFGDGENSQLSKDYANASPLAKLVILGKIGEAVDVYDRLVKSLKSSTEFDSEAEHLKAFANILKPYHEMMKGVLPLLPNADWNDMMENSYNHTRPSRESYLNGIANGRFYHKGFSSSKTSVGFNKLCTDAEAGMLLGDQQTVCREEFNVDAFAIGSKLDYNFSVDWPSNLEEYFTTFHQNMERVRTRLVHNQGVSTSLLPAEVKTICDAFSGLDSKLSAINCDGKQVEVVFQVPLRQHAGRIGITYDLKHPEKGYSIDVQAYGNDEHFRWDQIAGLGALLSSAYPGLSEDLAPQINYKKPDGARYAIKVASGFSKTQGLAQFINWSLKTMTMDQHSSSTILGELEGKMGAPQYQSVNKQFFSRGFYFAPDAINKLAEDEHNGELALAAKELLLGMARKGLEDYKKGGVNFSKKLSGDFLGKAEYDYVPGNTGRPRSIKTSAKAASILHLIRLAQLNVPEAIQAITELKDHPAILKAMPTAATALQRAYTEECLTQEERVALTQTTWEEGKFQNALKLYKKLPPEGQVNTGTVHAIVNEQDESVLRPLIDDLYVQKGVKGMEDFLDELPANAPSVPVVTQLILLKKAKTVGVMAFQAGDLPSAIQSYRACPEAYRQEVKELHSFFQNLTGIQLQVQVDEWLAAKHPVLKIMGWIADMEAIHPADIYAPVNDMLRHRVAARLDARDNLDQNRQALLLAMSMEERIRLSELVLLGASQQDSFQHRMGTNFAGLYGYLGSYSFDYVPDNLFSTTACATTAATLYLIAGMRDPNPERRRRAKEAVAALIGDFVDEGFEDQNKASMIRTLQALSRGYFQAEKARGTATWMAKAEVEALWKTRQDLCPNLYWF